MTILQKLQLEQSELREKVNGLLIKGELTDEERATLTAHMTRLQNIEPEMRAAIVLDEPPAPIDRNGGEGAEVRALLNRAEIRSYVGAAAGMRPVQGAEQELNDALNVREAKEGGVIIPWQVLDPGEHRTAAEHRADAATSLTLPGTNASGQGTMQDMVIGRVFAQTAAAFLGVKMASVGVGQHSYPVISAGQTGDLKDSGATHDATAATITGNVLRPKRLTARYVLRVEDLATMTGYEEALRADLNGALGERLDHFVLNGEDSTSPQWDGFIAALTAPSNPGARADYEAFLTAFGNGVDGRYATALSEVRLLVGSSTYGRAAGVTNTGSGQTAVGYANQNAGGMRASALIPAIASKRQKAILAKAGPGFNQNAVAPMWPGVELVRDPYSKAQAGEVAITAISLVDFALLRKAAYAQVIFQVSA